MEDRATQPAERRLFGDLLVHLGLASQVQVQEALALQSLTGQRVGEALISLGYVTRDQLQRALAEALGLSEAPAHERPQLGQILLRLKHINTEQLQAALARQKQDGRRLGEILVEQGACAWRDVYEALSLQQRDGRTKAHEHGDKAENPVLVVDDSPLACELVSQGLMDGGYKVVCFQDPFEALEQVSKIQPQIVLSDLDMPGIDGLELCRRLKDGPARAVPVIMLTANDGEAERVKLLRAGADDYVNKSASMDELVARIESVLRRTGETERVRKLFARYTSDAVVEEILGSGEVVLTGEKREATVLFADVRGFTGLAESLPPEQTVAVLNELLARLSDAVLVCGGTLDKFLGDGVMAVFGAPVKRTDDAVRALQAAKMMMSAVRELNQNWPDTLKPLKLPPLALGVGINSGLVVAGNVGSSLRTEYTCIGDAVNVASRLCAVAGPGEILVGHRTRELVGSAARFDDLPPVRLKGKAQPVPLFRAEWS